MKADFAAITQHILNALSTPAPVKSQAASVDSSKSTESLDPHHIVFNFLARVRSPDLYTYDDSD